MKENTLKIISIHKPGYRIPMAFIVCDSYSIMEESVICKDDDGNVIEVKELSYVNEYDVDGNVLVDMVIDFEKMLEMVSLPGEEAT